jgi:hypothetical protein
MLEEAFSIQSCDKKDRNGCEADAVNTLRQNKDKGKWPAAAVIEN